MDRLIWIDVFGDAIHDSFNSKMIHLYCAVKSIKKHLYLFRLWTHLSYGQFNFDWNIGSWKPIATIMVRTNRVISLWFVVFEKNDLSSLMLFCFMSFGIKSYYNICCLWNNWVFSIGTIYWCLSIIFLLKNISCSWIQD